MMSSVLTAIDLQINMDLKSERSIFQPVQNYFYYLVLYLFENLENCDQNQRFSMNFLLYFSKNVSKGNISQLCFVVNLPQFIASRSSSMNQNIFTKSLRICS